MKKPGYYLSEEAYIERLRKELSLKPNGRFPLTWIMEAADDISYCVADLEDAVEKRIFSVEELYQHLHDARESMKKVLCLHRSSRMPGINRVQIR